MTDGNDGEAATSELLTAISHDVRELVREELQRARTEFSDSIQASRRAAVLLGAAAMFGALGAGTSAGLLMRILDTALPRPVAGMVATAAFGAAAGGFGVLGLQELRQVRDQLTSD